MQKIDWSRFVLTVILPFLYSTPQAYSAETIADHQTSLMNMDLSSTSRTVPAPKSVQQSPVNIIVGGSPLTVSKGALLTPAERLAAYQVVSSGNQSLLLGANGNATGGTFNIGSKFGNYAGSLVIPQGVTAIQTASLNLLGNLTNSGNLYVLPSNLNINNATISALNVINRSGALISTSLPVGGVPGITSSALSKLNLIINAAGDISNSGIISSSAALNLSAGGSISNIMPANASSQPPLLHAENNIFLSSDSGSIVNSGIIRATNGSVDINTGASSLQSLILNNSGGTVEALNGAINIRDSKFCGVADTSLLGGRLLSKELNVFSGSGTVITDVINILGEFNISAAIAHTRVSDGQLYLGDITLSGDPTFYNDAVNGDITIGGNITTGESLAIVASRNIISSGDFSITANDGAKGFDISLIAGAAITTTGTPGATVGPGTGTFATWTGTGAVATNPVTITGPSASGGSIDFSGRTMTISSAAVSGNNDGGNVRLIAYHDSGTGTKGGLVYFSSGLTSTNSLITTGGSGTGSNGNVNIVAGSTSAGMVISACYIDATGGTGGGGSVNMINTQPAFTSGASLTFATDGSISSGNDFKTTGVALGGDIFVKQDIKANSVSMKVGGPGLILAPFLVRSTVPVGLDPLGIALNPTGTFVYVANSGTNTISIIDTATNLTQTVTVGLNPESVALSPNGSLLYVSNKGADTVSVVDTVSKTVIATIPVGNAPSILAVTPSGDRVYVCNIGDSTVSVIDTATNTEIDTITVGANVNSLAINPAGTIVYASTASSPTISVISTASNSVVDVIPVGELTSVITFNSSGTLAYAGHYNVAEVSVIDTSTNSVVDTIGTFGSGPQGLALSPSGAFLYVTNATSNNVSIIKTGDNSHHALIPVGLFPASFGNFVNYVGENETAYIANKNSDSVSIIQRATISAPNISMECVAGASITTSGNSNITSITPGFVTVSGKDSLTVDTSNVGSTFFAAAVGDISSTGVLTATNASFYSSNGNIGPITTSTSGTIKATAFGSVELSNTGNTTVGLSSGKSMKITSTGTFSETSGLSVDGVLDITASAVNTAVGTTVSAGTILVNGLAGSDLLIANAGTMKAVGNITINAPVDQDLQVGVLGETGNMQVGPTGIINLTSSSDLGANIVEFIGNQIFTGNTFVNAAGLNQSVTVQGGFSVIGNNALTVNSQQLNLLGSLQANPLIFASKGVGTIANSNAATSLDLKNLGNLTFQGQTLTILSAGNIINSGKSLFINLSGISSPLTNSGQGAGGSLQLIAGYNFTNGPILPSLPPSTGTFQLTTSNINKSISLTNVSINTSATSLFAPGGSVLAVATGPIKLGQINTSADIASGKGGDVTVIGNGVTTSGINTSALNSGTVSITSAIPSLSGTLTINTGKLYGGSFAAGTLGGNVRIGAITAGNGNINITTGGTGTITQSSTISTSGTLSLASAKSFTLKTAASKVSLNTSAATANAKITSSVLTSLLNSNVGGSLTVIGNAGLSVGASQTIKSGGPMSLSNTLKSASLKIQNDAVLTAGSLKGTAPASPAPLLSSDVLKAGSISITSSGIGAGSNPAISIGANASITANGASLTVKTPTVNADLVLGDGSNLVANGGAITISSVGLTKLGQGSGGPNLLARSLNNANGTISISSTGGAGLNIGDGSAFVSNKFVTLKTSSAVSTLSIGDAVQIQSGLFSIAPPPNQPFSPTLVTSKGLINIIGANNVTIGDDNQWSSIGGNIAVTAKLSTLQIGTNTAGTNNQFVANGGNLIMLAKGTVTGANGNFFHAIAMGTSAASNVGGGIEIGSGLTSSSALGAALNLKAPPINPAAGSLGAGVLFTGNINGAIKAINKSGNPNAINLNAGINGPSILNLNGTLPVGAKGGAQVFDAIGPGAAINMDNAVFQTEAFKPIAMTTLSPVGTENPAEESLRVAIKRTDDGITELVVGKLSNELSLFKFKNGTSLLVPVNANSLEGFEGKVSARIFAKSRTKLAANEAGIVCLNDGEIFLSANGPNEVVAENVKIRAGKGSLLSVQKTNGNTLIRLFSGSAGLSVTVGNQEFALNPGQEIFVGDRSSSSTLLNDKVGRRNTQTTSCGGRFVTFSDFSIVTTLAKPGSLSELMCSQVAWQKGVLARILKTAAVVDTVFRNRGNYTSN